MRAFMLYSGEVHIGDAAPVLTHTLTRTDLVVYAGASGDFNPMHTDEVAAQAAGQPSVFGHGMFSAGLLATALSSWVGLANLTSYKVRFAKQTWPGEELSTSVVVGSVDGDVIELDCTLVNADGQEKVVGSATARLGTRP
jgi:acyl dehydratase